MILGFSCNLGLFNQLSPALVCFVVAVEGRPDGHHHFGFPDPSHRAPSAPVAQDAIGNDFVSKYYLHVHGIIAALAFVILFPLGSIFIRLLPGRLALFAHVTWQLFTLIVALAAAGLAFHFMKRNPNTVCISLPLPLVLA